jgi:hypothetical protein
MPWGLCHATGWIIDPSIPASVHLVHILAEPAVMQQVQAAADHHQVNVATWLRHAMRQVTPDAFPARWRVGTPPSHRTTRATPLGSFRSASMMTPRGSVQR